MISTRVTSTLDRIETELNNESQTNLKVPPYHWFVYKDIKCGLLKCLRLNTVWVGFVCMPTNRKWPEDARVRPFRVGIDLDVQFNGEHLVGFHTMHLQDDVSLQGVDRRKTTDYVVEQLRAFIDALVPVKKLKRCDK